MMATSLLERCSSAGVDAPGVEDAGERAVLVAGQHQRGVAVRAALVEEADRAVGVAALTPSFWWRWHVGSRHRNATRWLAGGSEPLAAG
jgi:hypothetical protein